MINKRELNKKFIVNNILTIILFIITFFIIDTNEIFIGFILPLLNIILSFVLIYLSIYENKNNKEENSNTYYLINKYTSLYLNIGQILIILSLTLINFSFLTIFIEMLGLLLLVIGNYLPKLNSSKTIKSISFVVNKDKNKWKKYTRISGFTYMIIGLHIMILGIFDNPIIILISLLLIIISGVCLQLYSLALGKR